MTKIKVKKSLKNCLLEKMGVQPCNFIKKWHQHKRFTVNVLKFLIWEDLFYKSPLGDCFWRAVFWKIFS